ncbi:MAG: SDR family NAD(P)-dependent oxidoreductase [Pirellulales bacterium]|nr:SDR family NAD(P)-dependent oxidoreductase [Pirellulales bacterium]
MSYFRDKVVLVTGGSSGLGRMIAEAAAQAGAKVAIVGLEPNVVRQATDELGGSNDVLGVCANITRQKDVDRLFEAVNERFGQLDVLVNGAGRTDRGNIADTTPEQFCDLLELNFLATVRCTRAALPHLLARRGHLVNIGSLAAKTASRWLGAYPVTKFAVAAFSQQLRLELGPKGLHVLLVCPGPVTRKESRLYPLASSGGIPVRARRPGGGARTRAINPQWLAEEILRGCENRRPELVVPARARILFALAQLWPSLGDRILLRNT